MNFRNVKMSFSVHDNNTFISLHLLTLFIFLFLCAYTEIGPCTHLSSFFGCCVYYCNYYSYYFCYYFIVTAITNISYCQHVSQVSHHMLHAAMTEEKPQPMSSVSLSLFSSFLIFNPFATCLCKAL